MIITATVHDGPRATVRWESEAAGEVARNLLTRPVPQGPHGQAPAGGWANSDPGQWTVTIDSAGGRRPSTPAVRSVANGISANALSLFAVGLHSNTAKPVTAGQAYSAAVYGTSPVAFTIQISLQWRDASNSAIATTAGAALSATAGQWGRATVTAVAPAGAVSALPLVTVGKASGATVAGDTAWVADAIMVQGAEVPAWFDGDTSPDPAMLAEWLGEPHASESRLMASGADLPGPYDVIRDDNVILAGHAGTPASSGVAVDWTIPLRRPVRYGIRGSDGRSVWADPVIAHADRPTLIEPIRGRRATVTIMSWTDEAAPHQTRTLSVPRRRDRIVIPGVEEYPTSSIELLTFTEAEYDALVNLLAVGRVLRIRGWGSVRDAWVSVLGRTSRRFTDHNLESWTRVTTLQLDHTGMPDPGERAIAATLGQLNEFMQASTPGAALADIHARWLGTLLDIAADPLDGGA